MIVFRVGKTSITVLTNFKYVPERIGMILYNSSNVNPELPGLGEFPSSKRIVLGSSRRWGPFYKYRPVFRVWKSSYPVTYRTDVSPSLFFPKERVDFQRGLPTPDYTTKILLLASYVSSSPHRRRRSSVPDLWPSLLGDKPQREVSRNSIGTRNFCCSYFWYFNLVILLFTKLYL